MYKIIFFSSLKEIDSEDLLQNDYYLKCGVAKKTVFEKYSFIKDVDINRDICKGDEIMIEEDIYVIKDILFNCDEDCFSILTNYEIQHIPFDEYTEKEFLKKVAKYKLEEIKKNEELLPNIKLGKWDILKNKFKKFFKIQNWEKGL